MCVFLKLSVLGIGYRKSKGRFVAKKFGKNKKKPNKNYKPIT